MTDLDKLKGTFLQATDNYEWHEVDNPNGISMIIDGMQINCVLMQEHIDLDTGKSVYIGVPLKLLPKTKD